MRNDSKTPLVIGATVSEPIAPVNTGIIEIYDLIDSSGSMKAKVGDLSKYDAAIQGVKTKFKELVKDKNATYLVSGVEFGSYDIKGLVYEKRYWKADMNPALARSFRHMHSGTALNDSIVRLLDEIILDNPKGKVLVNIITDGEELHSRTHSDKAVYDKIEQCKALGYVITFMGTENDVKGAQRRYNIEASNTIAYDGTSVGLTNSMFSNISATMSYSKAVSDGLESAEELTRSFYSRS